MPPSANQPPSNTRRLLLQAMASTAVGFAPALKAIADDAVHSFPDGFVWGVAASAAQTESRDGRGRSNWDIFADRAGAIADGSSNVLCTEFEQRYSQDLSLLSAAGVKAFRFSIAWPRIQPDGPGAPSAQGLAFYDRLVDAMLERGMVPWPTIFHWDVPVWAGDFRDRSIAQRLADHAGIIGRKLGDRVRDWIVMNEPNSVALRGYGGSVLAPALNSPPAALAAVHHQNLAQGLAFQSLRAVLPAGCHIGTTISVAPIRPEGGRAENITAARTVDALWNRAFLDPLYGKGYPDLLKEHLAPLVKEGDMEIIAARPDFLGVNYYMCFYVKAAGEAPFGVAPGEPPPGLPRTAYFQVEPDGLTEVLSSLDADYGHPDRDRDRLRAERPGTAQRHRR